jgi:hypothetical protein
MDGSQDDHSLKEIELHLRALKAKEISWGIEHITTLDTVNDLGVLYAKQGNLREAEIMYVRALARFHKVLGANHEKTLKVSVELQELHSLMKAQGMRDVP